MLPGDGEAFKLESFSRQDSARIRLRSVILIPPHVKRIKNMVLRLPQTLIVRLLQLGVEYAGRLLEPYDENRLAVRSPKIRGLLKDREYLLLLRFKQTVVSIGLGWFDWSPRSLGKQLVWLTNG